MKLNKEIKILLIQILKQGEITTEQQNRLIESLSTELPIVILPNGTKIRI